MRILPLALVCAMLALPARLLATEKPDCSRPYSLALHDHGLLYSSQTGEGIDKAFADELIRRSGCKVAVTLMARARIWQLIESGALDFSLSGISNPQRERYAAFAWYFTNKYYLLVRNDTEVRSAKEFEDKPALRMGVIRSFRYGESANLFVDRLSAQGRVDYATTLDPLYAVLLEGRLHAMIIEPFDYPALQSAEIRARTVIVGFDDPPVKHGLIMSRRSIAPAQQQAWRALVDSMREDGTVERIFANYFKPELARALTHF